MIYIVESANLVSLDVNAAVLLQLMLMIQTNSSLWTLNLRFSWRFLQS